MSTLEVIVVALAVAAAALFVGWRLWRISTGREKTCGTCPGSCHSASRMAADAKDRSDGAAGKAPPSDG
jgi:uncharacterized membrane protein AbrB (regulator of aidB expression)